MAPFTGPRQNAKTTLELGLSMMQVSRLPYAYCGRKLIYDTTVLDSFNIPYRRPSSIKLEIPKRKHTTTNDVLRKSPAIANQYDGPSDTEKRALSISTLPRINPRTSNFRRRPSLKTFASSTSSGSFRSPDRFLPIRSTLDSAVESFRTSKDPRTLTMDEKLLRHKDASQDAFNPRRRATSPIPSSNRPVPRRNFSGNRSGSGGQLSCEVCQSSMLTVFT